MKIHKRKLGAIWFSPFTYCGLPAIKEFGIVPWKKVTCKNCLRSYQKGGIRPESKKE